MEAQKDYHRIRGNLLPPGPGSGGGGGGTSGPGPGGGGGGGFTYGGFTPVYTEPPMIRTRPTRPPIRTRRPPPDPNRWPTTSGSSLVTVFPPTPMMPTSPPLYPTPPWPKLPPKPRRTTTVATTTTTTTTTLPPSESTKNLSRHSFYNIGMALSKTFPSFL